MKEQENRIQDTLQKSFIGDYLKDEEITDISFNGTSLRLQHNEKGRYPADKQPSIEDVKRLIKQIADAQKKTFTNSEPELNTEIGFLRLNAMHEAISPDGMTFAIRVSRPRLVVSSIAEFTIGKGDEVEGLLKVLILSESNVIISGRTGVGKTEFQKLLVSFIPDDSKITLIEDTRDSHIKSIFPEKDINSWQTILGLFTMSAAVQAGLRNNPDWAIIAETRGVEAADVLDSAKTDHAIITTLHAKGAMNIPSRFIPMIRQSSAYAIIDDQLIGNEIVEFLRFGIHLHSFMEDGKRVRRIKEIVEYTDFTKKGAEGVYLYRHLNMYEEATNTYVSKEFFEPLSEQSLENLKDKQLYHLLSDVFKQNNSKEESL
ncbi:type II/IV secretion system ATPase subunit [Sporosarcina sp. resist]|uniref:ATPase, T2SS/T4P/T4SS family n=1 Tax=Sporosarcina sp. resist TaxID=2762563 RepID=UPI00164D7397|nr:ATPase, T2SS/T4P/T4SS family [Sporosarcina sp. resist]QNK89094.1 type II/IV secretion system ATPase subunit [Sporosarcina sp. resist]